MTARTTVVERYLDGFRRSDHRQVLDCLTDDVVWDLPGHAHLEGKEAFDREIENDAFTGSPTVRITRMVEENNVVIAEGTVRAAWKGGGVLEAVFCDAFEMEGGRIKRLISYLVMLTEQPSGSR